MTSTSADRIAIEETKARYCRCLDTKDWAGFADVFTEDVVQDTTESGGSSLQGRNNLVEMVRNAVGSAKTVHQVHSPEIRFLDEITAVAIFAMQDRILWPAERAQKVGFGGLTGWGHYHERYVRDADGTWRIAHQRLSRLFVETQPVQSESGE